MLYRKITDGHFLENDNLFYNLSNLIFKLLPKKNSLFIDQDEDFVHFSMKSGFRR